MLNIWIILLLFVYFVICFLLMAVILVQSGKGGGLSSLGSASQGLSDALGTTSAERTLNRITTGIAVGFMFLAIFISLLGTLGGGRQTADDLFGDESQAGVDATRGAATQIPAPAATDELPLQPGAAPEAQPEGQPAEQPAAQAPAPAEQAPAETGQPPSSPQE